MYRYVGNKGLRQLANQQYDTVHALFYYYIIYIYVPETSPLEQQGHHQHKHQKLFQLLQLSCLWDNKRCLNITCRRFQLLRLVANMQLCALIKIAYFDTTTKNHVKVRAQELKYTNRACEENLTPNCQYYRCSPNQDFNALVPQCGTI